MFVFKQSLSKLDLSSNQMAWLGGYNLYHWATREAPVTNDQRIHWNDKNKVER